MYTSLLEKYLQKRDFSYSAQQYIEERKEKSSDSSRTMVEVTKEKSVSSAGIVTGSNYRKSSETS
jgi:hypothetical protein